MTIIVKEGKTKIDHPSRDPNYENDVRVGRENYKKMTFESEGKRRDYEKAIASNPNNVLGLPEVFPPITIREAGYYNINECSCAVPSQVEDYLNCRSCGKPIVSNRNSQKDNDAKMLRLSKRIESRYCECAGWKSNPLTEHEVSEDYDECLECHTIKVLVPFA